MKTGQLRLLSTIAAVSLFTLTAEGARAQSVGYSLEPGASYIYWDDDLGLSNTWLYGGGLAFELGPRVRLTPFYLQADGVDAEPEGLEADGSPLFPDAEAFGLDVRHFGVDMDIDLITSSVTPFLRLGGGVLRMEPEDGGERLDRIALSYGGGLRFGIGRTSIRVSAEGNTFRLDPARLYDPASAVADEDERTNWVGHARLSIPISTQRESQAVGLVSSSAPIGIFGGSLNFADEMDMDDQRLAGVQAGISFNPLVSLVGFYWQGVNDDLDAAQDIRGYGGEAHFQLGSGTGVSPYLIAGGARIDYDEDSDDPEFANRTDQTALILGGGLNFRLTDRVDLQASVRDYLIDTTRELEDISDPGELVNNWLYSAGVTLRLGGTTAVTRSRREREAMAEERARLEEQIRRLEEGETPMPVDSLVVPRTARDSVTMRQQIFYGPQGQQIVLPVLEEGAIYIRFGPNGWDTQGTMGGGAEGMMMGRDDLRSIIQEELRSAAGDPAEDVSVDELEQRLLDRLEQRGVVTPTTGQAGLSPYLLERLDAIERRLMQRLDEMDARQRRMMDEGVTVEVIEGGERSGDAGNAFERVRRLDAASVMPYGGLSVGDNATQAVLGVRFDFGRVRAEQGIRFVPELALGFGEDEASFSAMGNFQLPLLSTGSRNLVPYVTVGAGIFTPTFLGLTTGAGAAFDLGSDGEGLRSFAEVQGINLFQRTRFLFGLSFPL